MIYFLKTPSVGRSCFDTKWFALAKDYSVIASARDLMDLKKIVGKRDVIYFKGESPPMPRKI